MGVAFRTNLLLAAVVALGSSCQPTADDDDTTPPIDDDDDTVSPNDDDDVTDDDDLVDDDDLMDDDDTECPPLDLPPELPPSSLDGLVPLAVLSDFDGLIAIATHEPTRTLAVIDERSLYLYDLVEPASPIEVGRFEAGELGTDAEWVDLAPADWGFVALGKVPEGDSDRGWVKLVLMGEDEPLLAPGGQLPPQEASPGVRPRPQKVAVNGTELAVGARVDADHSLVMFLSYESGEIEIRGERHTFSESCTGLGLDSDHAIWTAHSGLSVVPREPARPLVHHDPSGATSGVVWTEDGWLVLTQSSIIATSIYLLRPETDYFCPIGVVGVPGAGKPSDPVTGPSQALFFGDDIFFAGGGSGLLRTEWDPPEVFVGIDRPNPLWDFWDGFEPNGVYSPGGIAKVEDILVVVGSGVVGIIQIEE